MTNNYLFYTIYGFIQGITEFIPISSSAHLNLIEIVFNSSESRNYLYETSAHLASLLALLLYLSLHNHFRVNNVKSNIKFLVLATIPAIFLGIFLKIYGFNIISLKLIGYTSIIGAIMLYISDSTNILKFKIKNKSIKFIVVGIFQCLAFLPGFSRAGSCIIAFRFLNEDRKYSSIYSLYMGIPIISLSFLSNILDFEKFIFDKNLIIIFIITFVAAYFTVHTFINFIGRVGFTPFVIYRILLGIIILLYVY